MEIRDTIQSKQYEDLDSCACVNVAINTHCKWLQLHYINKTLQEKGEYDTVKRTCFRMLLDVYPQGYFFAGLLHNIMIHRITVTDSMKYELWFAIGKNKVRISKQKFCLITGLKFGRMLDVGNFERLGDATKTTLILIVNNILFGQDYRRRVTPWLLLLVEDIDVRNDFPWGHYVWRLTLDYLLKGFEVPSSNVQKDRLRYNIYEFVWVIQVLSQAIPALRKIVTPFAPKDVYPRMCRWQCNQKPKDFYKAVEMLESFQQLWVVKTLEPTPNEARQDYFVDIDVSLSEGHQYRCTAVAIVNELSVPELMEESDNHGNGSEKSLDHATTTPQPSIGPFQTHSANEESLTHSTRVNDGVVTKGQLQRIMHRYKKDMSELKASIQSLTLTMQTSEDRVIARILDDLKSQVLLWGDPSSHGAGKDLDDADDGHHDEPGVHIHDDITGAEGDPVSEDTIHMLHTSFPTEDARSTMEILDELRAYVEGEKLTYGKKMERCRFHPRALQCEWALGGSED
ncbi:Uncharacterized protein TCM_038014 [Theobroma cacao]|uniref:DUF1985 domain-containing protein n=1 Tax=Theobroma cacao TaxID=3641 RepID=A0A061GV04_THECC|nr:Uncharacterized protein TCM_038014 [Theobroma cacao]